MQAESRVDAYTIPLDAELAKAYLESHQIHVRLEGETLGGTAYALGPMMGGIKLYVEEQDEPRARELLDDYHRALHERPQVSDDDGDEFEDEAGADAGGSSRAGEASRRVAKVPKTLADENATRAWVAALAGLVLFPVFTHFYSIVCLLKIERHSLSARGRRRYIAAWIIDTAAILIAAWIVWRMFGE